MIDVNNQRDSASPLPLASKPKKGKSQTVTSTLPKSQGPEASGALSKKSKKPKSKKTPAETKASSGTTKSSTNMAWNLGSRMTAVDGRDLSGFQRKRDATEIEEDPLKKLMPASTIIRPDPDELVKVEFMINGRMVYLTEHETQQYWDKEEKMKKAAEEAKLLTMSKPEVIKVVREEAKKLRINPKEAISTKSGEKFKKAQDAKHEFLKREHFKRVKIPEQASSQTSRRKRKHMELEPKIKVPGLEYNRSLPEGIPFVNNMVIEEPEYRIFFTDVFGD
uniref:Uncharacterized protein n=1 Tax=Tanacetum cinerariifolium TaxID=118510 RepID=A0A6L2KMS9_TANCI|nr:hypothetical protein [Tanacetum cinerariifolium]